MAPEPERIVIVDDSEAARFFLKRAIRRARRQAEVVEFTYAEEALDYLRTLPERAPAHVLLDLNIPRLDGFGFLARLTAFPRQSAARIRVTMVTNSIAPQDETRALKHPLVRHILKKSDVQARLAGMLDG
jgi:CheY-like chemotaxis protein